MFTGLVADLGTVVARDATGDAARIAIATALAPELARGDSIAVNGVCLTATEIGADSFSADVVSETLRRSALDGLDAGARVNLELPVRASDRLGGHVVQGHVDGVGVVQELLREDSGARLTVALPPALLRYVVEKGSIALDGVSLTVAAVDERSLTVALIPETLARTTLGAVAVGSRINVEVDVLAKHVEKLLAGVPGVGAQSSPTTEVHA
jgi:riboflavin synthase